MSDELHDRPEPPPAYRSEQDVAGYRFERYGDALLYRVANIGMFVVIPVFVLLVFTHANPWIGRLVALLAVAMVVANRVLFVRAADAAGNTSRPMLLIGIGTEAGQACWRAAGARLRRGRD